MSATIFVNARIITSFEPLKYSGAMLVKDGLIAAIGEEEAIMTEAPHDAKRVELGGKIVMPGFVDAHMHLDNLGEYLNEIDLKEVSSISELQTKIRGSHGLMGWVLGHGWDELKFAEHRMPTRHDIEAVESERPVYLSRIDLHSAVLNTKAIDILELRDRFHKSENLLEKEGELTGVVRENVFEYVDRAIKEKCSQDRSCTMLSDAISEAARNGVTTVGFVSCSITALKALERLRDEGLLKIRVRAFINADELDRFNGFRDDEMLKVVGVKIFGDGSLGTRTAYLSFSYKDDPDNRGVEITNQKKMLEVARRAEDMGLHVTVHAIGDRALDNVIDVFQKLKGKHRIDHVSLIRKDQLDELEQFSSFLVVQPHFIITDFWMLERIGRSRAHMAYLLKTLKERGFDVAFSTDSPVESVNPWETIYAAVTRGRPDGSPLGQVSNEERLTVGESIDFYTRGSAKALYDDDIGVLEVGRRADFIVLERDPFESDYSELRKMRVLETYVNGDLISSV